MNERNMQIEISVEKRKETPGTLQNLSVKIVKYESIYFTLSISVVGVLTFKPYMANQICSISIETPDLRL